MTTRFAKGQDAECFYYSWTKTFKRYHVKWGLRVEKGTIYLLPMVNFGFPANATFGASAALAIFCFSIWVWKNEDDREIKKGEQ